VHIVEPDLEGLVNHVVKKGFLKAESKLMKTAREVNLYKTE
jgi:hypothetical protein